jgi:anti-anti-sigma regulatory factor
MAAQARSVHVGETTVALEAHFDAADAWAVHEAIRSADRRRPLVIDFTQVHTYEDFAVALLAPDLGAPGELRIRVRGLGAHQRRLLEYFGVTSLAIEHRPRRRDDDADDDEERRPVPAADLRPHP